MKRPTIPGVGASGTPPRASDGPDRAAGGERSGGARQAPSASGARPVPSIGSLRRGVAGRLPGSGRSEKPGRSGVTERTDDLSRNEKAGRTEPSRQGKESRLLDELLRTQRARRAGNSETAASPASTSTPARTAGSAAPTQASRTGRAGAATANPPRIPRVRAFGSGREQSSGGATSPSAPGTAAGSATAAAAKTGAASALGTRTASSLAVGHETAASVAVDAATGDATSEFDLEPIPGRFTVWRQLRRARSSLRRVEHDEVRRFTRRARVRRRMVWGSVAGVVLVMGGLLVALFSPAMSLKTIQIQGGDAAVQQSVQQGLSAQIGRPLPLVSMSKVDSVVQGQARVASYTTRIEPPSTISISLVLRTPLAAVQQGASWSVVDATGVVLSTGTAQPPGLPVLTFGGAARDPKASSAFLAAADVLSALPAALRATVSTASATSPDAVVLVGPGGSNYVFGGTNNIAYKAQVLAALLKAAPGQAIYDVSSPDAPVTN